MMNRYQITVMDNHTGRMVKAPMEGDAFAIVVFHGPRSPDGIHERMRCWMKGGSMNELACALYSDPQLRKAARMSVWRGWLWEMRRLLAPWRCNED